MDLASKQWSPVAVRATAPGLDAKLPPLADSWTVLGTLAPYWRQKYGFPAARVVAWSGDNPCSLVGTGLVREGIVAISLGTSDTIFGIMPTPRPSEDGTATFARRRRLHGHVAYERLPRGARARLG
jgi:xylulokinase